MIVIGASIGGARAVKTLLQALPPDFPDSLVVVLHRHRDSDLALIEFLQEDSPLPVREIEDKQPVEPGILFVAPPDYHILIDQGRFSLSIDEPVRYARPSVDVLFESAAAAGYANLVGVILTGGGGDGASGAAAIEAAGGKILVQSPEEAAGSDMPKAALAGTRNAEVQDLKGIAQRITELARAHGASK
jgi:two-component system chemotaxis response regulator CheB